MNKSLTGSNTIEFDTLYANQINCDDINAHVQTITTHEDIRQEDPTITVNYGNGTLSTVAGIQIEETGAVTGY